MQISSTPSRPSHLFLALPRTTRSVMLLGASPSSGALVAAALAPVDMEAALSQHPNLGLCWQLLYEPQWQVGLGCTLFVRQCAGCQCLCC